MLKNFTNHEKKLSNCLMIVLELYLNLSTKQYQVLKILTPKQMLQKLTIDLAQVKVI